MTQPLRPRVRKSLVLLLAQTFVAARCTETNNEFLCHYLKGVKKQLAVHADLPAQSFERVRHPNKDDVVDAKHQHQHQRRLGQFSGKRHTHTHTRAENAVRIITKSVFGYILYFLIWTQKHIFLLIYKKLFIKNV